MMRLLTRQELRALPKAELHIHLRGAAPPDLLLKQAEHYGPGLLDDAPADLRAAVLSCPNVASFMASVTQREIDVRTLFTYRDFQEFLMTYLFTGYLFRRREDLAALIDGAIKMLREQGVVYAEITVDASGFGRRGIAMDAVWECLAAGARSEFVQVRWIVDLVRDFGPDECGRRLRDLIAASPEGVVGITLGGSEHRFPPAPFASIFREAKEAGLRLTVHAGEALGPPSVRDALDLLGVERIGHGVRSTEEPALLERLAEEQITLEVCPTSNVFTGVYANLAAHPLPNLVAAGVPVTLNSDDPTFFGATLIDECLAAQEMGLSAGIVLGMLEQGFRSAFAAPPDVASHIAALRAARASTA